MGQAARPQVRPLRVGSIIDGIVWMGGSNLSALRKYFPMHVGQYRPRDYRSAVSTKDHPTAGLPETRRLTLSYGKQTINIVDWMDKIKTHIEEYGMDTVFRVCSISNNAERYLLEE